MSCTPRRTPREARMLRAIAHAMFRNHELDLACTGCLEVLGFATVRGYEGRTDYPTCSEALGPNDSHGPCDPEEVLDLDAPAPTAGSYGDGLHHTHQCPLYGTTFPCGIAHPRGSTMRQIDLVGMCPFCAPSPDEDDDVLRAHGLCLDCGTQMPINESADRCQTCRWEVAEPTGIYWSGQLL